MSIDVTPRETASLSERVAEEIRALMARRRVRQSHLARELGVSEQWISVRLRGVQPIDLNDLEKIANALSVPVTDLIPRGSLITDAYPEVPEKMTLPAPHPVDIRRSAHPRPRRRRDLGRTSILERATACATP